MRCEVREESKVKRLYLAGLKGLTIEERLENIEEGLYELKKRVSEMEPIVDSHRPCA